MLGNPIVGDRSEVLIKRTKGLPISLTNINEAQVMNQSIEEPNDTERFVFSTNNLTSGIYLLKVVNVFQAVVIKIIK